MCKGEILMNDDFMCLTHYSKEGISLEKNPGYTLNPVYSFNKNHQDLAVDECGNIFIVDGISNQIRLYNPSNIEIDYLICVNKKLKSINEFEHADTIALNHKTLYVADNENKLILSFARSNGQLKSMKSIIDLDKFNILNKSDDISKLDTFEPNKITADNNFIYLLGSIQDNSNTNNLILKFDNGFTYLEVFDTYKNSDAISISADDNGFLYVLGSEKNEIFKFSTTDGNIIEVPELDLNKFSIQASEFIIGLNCRYYLITMDSLFLMEFVEDRYLLNKKSVYKQFDSRENGCKWHRIDLEAYIPIRTNIILNFYISDVDISDQSLIPWTKLATFQSSNNLYDVLIPNGKGRFLYILTDLISTDEYSSPIIWHINAYLPRISYLRYLPAVYQEDEFSSDFLEKFLSIFETFMWRNEQKIKNITSYFDADSTPTEFLPWLASWTATVFDESWSENKRRKFLRNAVNLYKKRGTRLGLEELIEIYTGNTPIIVENWQLNGTDTNCHNQLKCKVKNDDKDLCDDTDSENQFSNNNNLDNLFGKSRPFNFCVIFIPYMTTLTLDGLEGELKIGPISNKLVEKLTDNDIPVTKNAKILDWPENGWIIQDKVVLWITKVGNEFKIYQEPSNDISGLMNRFRRLIENEKPAHTSAGVVILEPLIYLDMHTYLGINTFLSKPNKHIGMSTISRDTVLTDHEDSGQIENRSRIGMDTRLT